MTYEIVTNPIVLMVLCGLITFGLMFIFKLPIVKFTKAKFKNEKVRRIANLVLGTLTSIETAIGAMWFACDLLNIDYLWNFAIASGFIATGLYLALEKVLGAEVDAIGKLVSDFISHSKMFDGKLSQDGAYIFIKNLATSIAKVDDADKQKEIDAVNAAHTKLSEFLFDGKITEEEMREAETLSKETGIDITSFYETYRKQLK